MSAPGKVRAVRGLKWSEVCWRDAGGVASADLVASVGAHVFDAQHEGNVRVLMWYGLQGCNSTSVYILRALRHVFQRAGA